MATQRSEAARTLGLIGGAVRSEKKAKAARENWKKAIAGIKRKKNEALANKGEEDGKTKSA